VSDEREELARILDDSDPEGGVMPDPEGGTWEWWLPQVDAILAAGFRRQGQITDAQVEAAIGVWLHNDGPTDHDDMRAALEAAREVES
jgi:hypothetical protein